MERFTREESNLMYIFYNQNRRIMVADLQRVLPYLEDDMTELVQSVVGKLECMTDREFWKEVPER